MRKLLERLRLWLIRKLGGYTVEYSQTIHPVRADISYRILQATCRLDNWERTKMQVPELVWYSKNRLCEALAKELLSSDEVLLEATEDPIQNALLVRARMFVVEGKAAALYLNVPLRGYIRLGSCLGEEEHA